MAMPFWNSLANKGKDDKVDKKNSYVFRLLSPSSQCEASGHIPIYPQLFIWPVNPIESTFPLPFSDFSISSLFTLIPISKKNYQYTNSYLRI